MNKKIPIYIIGIVLMLYGCSGITSLVGGALGKKPLISANVASTNIGNKQSAKKVSGSLIGRDKTVIESAKNVTYNENHLFSYLGWILAVIGWAMPTPVSIFRKIWLYKKAQKIKEKNDNRV